MPLVLRIPARHGDRLGRGPAPRYNVIQREAVIEGLRFRSRLETCILMRIRGRPLRMPSKRVLLDWHPLCRRSSRGHTYGIGTLEPRIGSGPEPITHELASGVSASALRHCTAIAVASLRLFSLLPLPHEALLERCALHGWWICDGSPQRKARKGDVFAIAEFFRPALCAAVCAFRCRPRPRQARVTRGLAMLALILPLA